MIKFFRKIRFRLMSENKTGKYLKYALGEIILVMIGILLALQVNNWNEHKKETKQERELLIFTLENIKSDSLSIEKIISKTDRVLEVQHQLIGYSTGGVEKEDINNLDLIRGSEPNVLITKKNNPNLPQSVNDLQLKKVILDYYLAIDWLEFTVSNHNEIIENAVRPFLAEKELLIFGNQLEVDLDKLNLINNELFFEEFKNESLKQILFESGIKLRIMRANAERTLLKNELVKQAIKNYLNE